MKIEYLSIDALEWRTLVAEDAGATPFHTAQWSSLLAECYGFRPFVLAVKTDAGAVAAAIPFLEIAHWGGKKRWVSLPFTDSCRLLCKEPQATAELIHYLSDLCRRGDLAIAEVRGPVPQHRQVYTSGKFVHHALPLCGDAQAVFKTFNPSRVAQKILQASKRGVRVEFGTKWADLEIFYRLHVKTRHRLGVPVQPKLFFRLLQKHIMEKGLGYTLLAYKDKTPIAGLVFLYHGNTVAAKYSASDPEFWNLRPNNLLYWEAIRWGCEEGFGTFDLGRTDHDDQNLREFKNGWGTKEEPLAYSVISMAPPKISSKPWYRYMKLVIRHSPTWICQAIGEMFYRYAA